MLRPQIEDTDRQDHEVRASGLDWVLAQPVNLTDADESRPAFASTAGATAGMRVARTSVGRFLAEAVDGDAYGGRTVALSAVESVPADRALA
jgi:hypothetical protein